MEYGSKRGTKRELKISAINWTYNKFKLKFSKFSKVLKFFFFGNISAKLFGRPMWDREARVVPNKSEKMALSDWNIWSEFKIFIFFFKIFLEYFGSWVWKPKVSYTVENGTKRELEAGSISGEYVNLKRKTFIFRLHFWLGLSWGCSQEWIMGGGQRGLFF